MTSDNHFDINHVDSVEMMRRQAQFLRANKVNYYLIAGDLFNDFQQSMNYVEQLAQLLHGDVAVRFIAGNHDMLRNITYEALETLKQVNYLHNRSEDLEGTQWRLIGNNGWYDYSLSQQAATAQQFAKWKNAYWVDQIIEQPGSDLDRMQLVLQQVEAQLKQAQHAQKKVLFMTHFVPKKEFIVDAPDNRMWNMSNGMMGSFKMGELLEKYHVAHVLFGHLHIHPDPLSIGRTTYYNQAVGYRNNHTNEWLKDNFYDQWCSRLKIISLE